MTNSFVKMIAELDQHIANDRDTVRKWFDLLTDEQKWSFLNYCMDQTIEASKKVDFRMVAVFSLASIKFRELIVGLDQIE